MSHSLNITCINVSVSYQFFLIKISLVFFVWTVYDIITFVWQVFKEPLECPTLRGSPILSAEDLKGIFGNVVDIMDAHRKIQVSGKFYIQYVAS